MQFRYARHSNNISQLETFYTQIVGLEYLGGFQNHDGYDGVFVGNADADWHLEFTSNGEYCAQRFDEDDILVFYVYSQVELTCIKRRIEKANIPIEAPRNPYWKSNGIMISDPDGYKVVFAVRQIQLTSKDALIQMLHQKAIKSWDDLITYVQYLPYGRNENRYDFSLVLKEGKGTCSSKHALLKAIANANNVKGVKLILGMYKMNQGNTPKIGDTISKHGLDHIPEAHCYLKLNNCTVDITTPNHQFEKLAADIIEEIEIEPDQVNTFKVDYHQAFLKKWMQESNISMSFDELWHIREQCIQKLGE